LIFKTTRVILRCKQLSLRFKQANVVYHRTRMDRRSVHFTYQPTSHPPYYLRCFFLVLFLLLLALLLFRASLRTRCKSERASKHVSEPVPRLQNGLFLALRMLCRQECRKDSRCSVNIYERLRKSIQARILAIVSYYVSNAFFTTHEVVRIIQLTFLKSCSVHFPAFDTILIFATFKNYSN